MITAYITYKNEDGLLTSRVSRLRFRDDRAHLNFVPLEIEIDEFSLGVRSLLFGFEQLVNKLAAELAEDWA